MGLFDGLRAIKDQIVGGVRGTGLTDEQLASLTPAQRAAYDANQAQIAAIQAAAQAEVEGVAARRFAHRPLQGPAGEWVHGSTTAAANPDDLASMSTAALLELESRRQKEMWGDLRRNPFGGRGDPPPAAPPVSSDPAVQAAAELQARAEARAPYLAPQRGPIRVTRVPGHGGDDLTEVRELLASSGLSARPDLVFGIHRVPDHHPMSSLLGRKRAYVEWDIVHADVGPLPPGPVPEVVTLDAEERWVERAVGEPSVLDEDVALAYLASAGVGPERTLGIARRMEVRSLDADETSGSTMAIVTGVHVLHTAPDARATLDAFGSTLPATIPFEGMAGVHVEVLNWRAVAEAVHPQSNRPAPIPSPFPYLPGSALELLVSYLEVVGIHPAHCFAAEVVEDGPRRIDAVTSAGPFTVRTNVGAEEVCADGEHRRRLHAGSLVVVAHLDAPAYEEGRARWAAYQREALQATLELETGARRAVEPTRLGHLSSGAQTATRLVEGVGDFVDGDHEWLTDFPRHRYCWPPVDRLA